MNRITLLDILQGRAPLPILNSDFGSRNSPDYQLMVSARDALVKKSREAINKSFNVTLKKVPVRNMVVPYAFATLLHAAIDIYGHVGGELSPDALAELLLDEKARGALREALSDNSLRKLVELSKSSQSTDFDALLADPKINYQLVVSKYGSIDAALAEVAKSDALVERIKIPKDKVDSAKISGALYALTLGLPVGKSTAIIEGLAEDFNSFMGAFFKDASAKAKKRLYSLRKYAE